MKNSDCETTSKDSDFLTPEITERISDHPMGTSPSHYPQSRAIFRAAGADGCRQSVHSRWLAPMKEHLQTLL